MKRHALPSVRYRTNLRRRILNDWQIYVLLLPALIYFFVYTYLPMYGLQIVFKDYKFIKGIAGSNWVGFKHFEDFFSAYYFGRLITNTFLLNFLNLLITFPIPIILAILLNQFEFPRYKKFTQTAIYIPHFISTTVMVGILYLFLSPDNGIINHFIEELGGKPIHFMILSQWFRPLYIGTENLAACGLEYPSSLSLRLPVCPRKSTKPQRLTARLSGKKSCILISRILCRSQSCC